MLRMAEQKDGKNQSWQWDPLGVTASINIACVHPGTFPYDIINDLGFITGKKIFFATII